MYTPKHFINNDTAEIKNFIRENGFGILVTYAGDKPIATHIPLELSANGTTLSGHVARANPQWKTFEESNNALVIFNGPHAYISSSWYDHENVPTWNYIAVHVYGKIKIIEGDALYASLKNMVDKYEKTSARPVSLETMSADYVKKAMNGVVGIEIAIENLQATYKLSQNRDEKNYNQIVHELEKRKDEHSSQIALSMKRNSDSIFRF
jgi:transcriptional regulator